MLVKTWKGSIIDQLSDDASLMGYVNEKNTDWSYLTDYTLNENFTVADNKTLTIVGGATLTIADSAYITKGNEAQILNRGAVKVSCDHKHATETGFVDSGNSLTLVHTFSGDWKSDNEGHWHKCAKCDVTTDKETHTETITNTVTPSAT